MYEKKSLMKNSIFNIIYKGFTAVFPLLTTTYIARVLLPEGVGKVEYAMTVVSYFVTVASLGIPSYGIKAISQATTEKERSNIFIELILINFISTAICTVCYYLFIFNVSYFSDRVHLFCVVGLMLFLNLFNIEWFLQGVEEYSYIAVRGILIKMIAFIGMLCFVKNQSDYIIYAFILCVGTAGNYLLNIFRAKKYIVIKNCDIHIKRHLVPVLVLFATTIATQLYTMLDSIMLEFFHGEVYVGYYSTSVKIVRMIYSVSIALVAPFYPRISGYVKEGKMEEMNDILSKGVRIVSIIAVPSAIGLFLMSDWIVLVLFGTAFYPSIITLKILCPLVVVFSFAYLLGHIVLMSLGKEKNILYSTIIGASINIVLNALLIPRFQHNGAAISSLVAEIIVTLYVISVSRKNISIKINYNFFLSLVLAISLMCLVVIFLRDVLFDLSLANMFLICFIASILYFFVLFILKNEELICIYHIIR